MRQLRPITSILVVGDLTLRGAVRRCCCCWPCAEAWNYTSWVTNYFDPDTRPVRLMLVG